METSIDWSQYLSYVLIGAIGFNLLTLLFELTSTHPTVDAQRTVDMILHGRYARLFYAGALVLGNILPLLILLGTNRPELMALAGIATLAGIYITEHIWVEAPQRIPLS